MEQQGTDGWIKWLVGGFARIFEEVAKETDSALVPFFLEDIGERLEYFQPDRIHPNESAQPLMLERVWPALQKLL